MHGRRKSMTALSPRLRPLIRFAVPLALIPALTIGGALIFEKRRYLVISAGVLLLTLLLFAAGYESKRVSSASAAATSVMTALAVTGRLIPVIKPVSSIIILTGVWLGPEAGFLCGALTALISNMLFGQGPWTPFQMMTWGLIGLASGYLSALLKKSRILLMLFGAFSGLAYSLLMDIYTVISTYGEFSAEHYFASVVTAIPFTITYMISDMLFLFLLSRPLGLRLSRLKERIGQ